MPMVFLMELNKIGHTSYDSVAGVAIGQGTI